MYLLRYLIKGWLTFVGLQVIFGLAIFLLIYQDLIPKAVIDWPFSSFVLVIFELLLFLAIIYRTYKKKGKMNMDDLESDIEQLRKTN